MAYKQRFQVQQHDGLRWESFAWNHTRAAADENYAGSVRCWPDRPHRILSPSGECVVVYDPRRVVAARRAEIGA